MDIIKTEFFQPHNLLVILAFSILGLWLAKKYLPHPATQPPGEVANSSNGYNANDTTQNDISIVDMGSPDFRTSSV